MKIPILPEIAVGFARTVPGYKFSAGTSTAQLQQEAMVIHHPSAAGGRASYKIDIKSVSTFDIVKSIGTIGCVSVTHQGVCTGCRWTVLKVTRSIIVEKN